MTMFYSSIFATAVFLDADAKTKRRNEWEKKIGEVKEEVTTMKNEEARMVENILSRKRMRVSTSPPLRRRQYSTMAAGAAFAPPKSYQDEMQQDGLGRLSSQTSKDIPPSEQALEPTEESALDTESDPWNDDGSWSTNDPLRVRAIQRLATKQLVIRFMLRPTVGSNYSGVRMGYPSGLELPKLNTEGLLEELNSIRKRMNTLKYSESEVSDPLLQDISWTRSSELHEERDRLDDELHSLLFQRPNTTSSPEMLLRICDNLLSTEEPISSSTMSLLMQYFVRARENDLASIVLTTLLPAKIQLSRSVIITSLNFFSKARDLYGFEGFLRRLQGAGGAVNIPKFWEARRVGKEEVPVPPAPGHPFVYNGLICAAIKFEQFDKANAWLHMMRQTGYGGDHSVLGAFLRCYGEKSDWEKGAPFLLSAVNYIMSSKAHKRGVIERLIVYMLVFCQNCQKTALFSDIISAAVESGFRWELGRTKKDTNLLFKVAFNSWRDATEKSATSAAFDRTTAEKCQSFGELIKESIQVAVNEKNDPTAGTRRLKHGRRSDMNSRRYASENTDNFTTSPATSSDGAPIEQNKSPVLDSLRESHMPDADSFYAHEQKQLRAEVSSLRKELSELRKLVKRNNPDAFLAGERQPETQLGEQQATSADQFSKFARFEKAEVTPKEAPSREFFTYGGKSSGIHDSQLPARSSTKTRPHTSHEKHSSLAGVGNRTKIIAQEIGPVSRANEAESKPHFSSSVSRHNSPSSPPSSPALRILRVRSELRTTTHRSG